MSQNRNQEKLLIKKSYEICYALVRIASSLKKEGFARRLEDNGFLLLEAASSGELGRIGPISAVLEWLLRLGADAGFLHHANAEAVSRELNYLNAAIAEFGNAAKAEEVPINDIFSDSALPVAGSDDLEVFNADGKKTWRGNNSLENGNGSGGVGAAGPQRSAAKAAIRQSMILERIRQNDNCRMKEIQDVLPEVSERTLRYDLQDLIERGAVERTGNGGPATSYKTISA